MKIEKKYFFLIYYISFASFFILQGCSSTSLVVDSTPANSEVEIVLTNGDRKKIGNTPVDLDLKEYERYPYIFLQINKNNKFSNLILIPKSYYSYVGKINLSLDQIESKNQIVCKNPSEWNDDMIAQVISAQNYIHKKNYEEAQNILVNLTGKYPHSFSLWSLLGNSYYLAKKKIKALESFEKALSLNPSAHDIKIIIEQLRKE